MKTSSYPITLAEEIKHYLNFFLPSSFQGKFGFKIPLEMVGGNLEQVVLIVPLTAQWLLLLSLSH